MNPHDKDPNAKEDFEKDLEQVEAVYRQSGLDEPSALLDQAILNKAKRAMDKPAARPWSFGWIHAAATTALVVLGLTLVNQQRDEMGKFPEPLDLLWQTAAPSSAAVSTGAALQDTLQFRENAAGEIFSSAEKRRAEVAKAAAQTETDQPDAGQVSRQIVSELRESDPVLYELRKAEPVDNTLIPVIVVRDKKMPEEMGLRRRDQALSGDISSEPETDSSVQGDAVNAPESAYAANENDEEVLKGANDARTFKVELERNAPAPVMASKAATLPVGQQAQELTEQKDQDSLQQASGQQLETRIDPGQWLQDIRKLKEADPQGRWREELRAFREIYPDYPVPDELLAALPEPPEPE